MDLSSEKLNSFRFPGPPWTAVQKNETVSARSEPRPQKGAQGESLVIVQRPEKGRVLKAFSIYPRFPELNQESGRRYRHEIQK